MSLIFFVNWLLLLEEMLLRRWKLCMMTFLITQHSNIITDEKDSIWKNWYAKIQNKLKININLFLNEQVILNYVHFRLFNDAA